MNFNWNSFVDNLTAVSATNTAAVSQVYVQEYGLYGWEERRESRWDEQYVQKQNMLK